MNNVSTSFPTFLYGTAWKENKTQGYVENALASGFRGIDTANQRKHYFEAAVGDALKNVFSHGNVSRKDIFLQTKFTSIDGQDQRLPYDENVPISVQVQQSFESSLEHLNTDYIDSYILHGPSTYDGLTDDDWEIWSAMEKLFTEQKVKYLGVSNVNLDQLKLLNQMTKIKPKFVQNRCYAKRGWDKEVRAYCKENKITYQGFSLLTANPEVFQSLKFQDIVRRVNCSPAQAVFNFAIQVGMLPLTGTTDPLHMKEDLGCLKFNLSKADVKTIEDLYLYPSP